jgi:PAS domain S-box-containing protein
MVMVVSSSNDAMYAFLDEVLMGITILDKDLRLVWANRYFRERIDTLAGVCGKHCFAGLDPGEERCEDCLPLVVQRTGMARETVRTVRNPIGTLSYFRVVAARLSDDSTCTIILPLPAEDMEGERSWRERFLLSAIRNGSDAVFALDRTHTVRFWNRGAERIFGWPIQEMVGQPVHTLFPDEDWQVAEEVFTPVDPVAHLDNRELALTTRDKGKIWVEVSRTPLLDGSGRPNGFSFVIRDITQRKQTAEQLAYTERLTAVGNMAAALAHEIGTPLGIISNNAEYLMLDLGENDPRRADLEIIVRETDRISGLVRELLRFSRPDPPELEALRIEQVLERVRDLTHHASQKQSTRVEIETEPDLPRVLGDVNQLEQVILNLTMNGLQALQRGGELRLTARSTSNSHEHPPGRDGIEIAVADDGPGLPQDSIDKLFEPFFTTKSNGTGLGLAVCKSLVTEHGGTIRAEDVPGGGACFRVWLPAHRDG